MVTRAAVTVHAKKRHGEWKPLEKGRISIQGEWAELQYHAVRIREFKD